MSSGVIKTLTAGQGGGRKNYSGSVEVPPNSGTVMPFRNIDISGTKDTPAVGDTVDVTISSGAVTAIVDNS